VGGLKMETGLAKPPPMAIMAMLTPSPNMAIIPKINNILSFGDVLHQNNIAIDYLMYLHSSIFIDR
jgi:hypothetical protein